MTGGGDDPDLQLTAPSGRTFFSKFGPLQHEPSGSDFLVFISHSGHQKQTFVEFLVREFAQKYPELHEMVFVDQYSLKGGDDALEKMHKALGDACVAVVVLSEEFLTSAVPMDELCLLVERLKRNRQTKEARPETRAAVILPVFYKISWDRVEQAAKMLGASVAKAAAVADVDIDEDGTLRLAGMARSADALDTTMRTAGFTGIQVGGKEKKSAPEVIEAVVKRTVEILADMGKLPSNRVQKLPEVSIGLSPPDTSLLSALLDDVCYAAERGCALLVYGMPGSGKTVLAKAAFNSLHNEDRTTPACFVQLQPFPMASGSPSSAEQQTKDSITKLQSQMLRELAHHEYQPTTTEAGQTRLAEQLAGKRVLLFVDGVWEGQLPMLLPAKIMQILAPSSKVLVTSRGPLSGATNLNNAMLTHQVQGLSEEQSRTLLEMQLRHLAPAEDGQQSQLQALLEDSEAVNWIISHCDGLPAALVAVSRHVAGNLGCGALRESLRHLDHDLLSAAYSSSPGLFDRIHDSWQALTPEEQVALMDIVWFFNTEARSWVSSYCKYGFMDKLQQVGLLRYVTAAPKSGLQSMQQQQQLQQAEETVWVHPAVTDFCRLDGRLEHQRGCLQELKAERLETEHLDQTEGLLLQECELDEAGCEALGRSKSLRIIEMGDLRVEIDQDIQRLSLASQKLRWIRCNKEKMPDAISVTLKHGKGAADGAVVALQSLEGIKELTVAKSAVQKGMKRLTLANCSQLQSLTLKGLQDVRLFEVSGCPGLGSVAGLGSLTHLGLTCSDEGLVESMLAGLSSLKSLVLQTSLSEIPSSIGSLASLTDLTLSSCTGIQTLPSEMSNLQALSRLTILRCPKLQHLQLPSTLQSLCVQHCASLSGVLSLAASKPLATAQPEVSTAAHLTRLSSVVIVGCSKLEPWPCPQHLPSSLRYIFEGKVHPCGYQGRQCNCKLAPVTAAAAPASAAVTPMEVDVPSSLMAA